MSSFGPINSKRPRYGDCLYCFNENYDREHSYYFESRQRMIGPVCGHRLKKAKFALKQFRINRSVDELRKTRVEYQTDYWSKRALLPEYCGEPGELAIGFAPPFPSWYEDQHGQQQEVNLTDA